MTGTGTAQRARANLAAPKNDNHKKEPAMNFTKRIILASALATCLGAPAVHAEQSYGPRFPGDTWDFRNPRLKGAIVDACAEWGNNCGAGGAAQYCRLRGFNGALSWSIDYPGRTFVIGSNQFCNGPQCRGFSFVKCR
jgi:hypothetical protein